MSEKRYAVLRALDETGEGAVIATITNGSDEYGQHPLPQGFQCVELPPDHKNGDVLPGDVWNERGRAFEKKSDQRAQLAAQNGAANSAKPVPPIRA